MRFYDTDQLHHVGGRFHAAVLVMKIQQELAVFADGLHDRRAVAKVDQGDS